MDYLKVFSTAPVIPQLFFTFYRFALQAYGALTYRGAAGKFAKNYSPLRLMGILLKAYGSGVRFLPRMWKKRKKLRPLKKVSYGEVISWFRRFGIRASEISLRD